jgi:hypothetical protein
MYCPKCGNENSEGARFCMHCGVDLSGYKVEISPRINVAPKIEVRTSAEKIGCDICGERKAVVTCSECGRTVCNFHFENETKCCTLCTISHFEGIVTKCGKGVGGSIDYVEFKKYAEKCIKEKDDERRGWMDSCSTYGRSGYFELVDICTGRIQEYKNAIEKAEKIEKLKRKLPPELR